MGRNNQRRRAAKKRDRDRQRALRRPGTVGRRPGPTPPGGWDDRYCWYHQRWHGDGVRNGGGPGGDDDPLGGRLRNGSGPRGSPSDARPGGAGPGPQAWPGYAGPGTPSGSGGAGLPRAAARPDPSRRNHDPKTLARIRALLAKAESTEFPEEAEALAGKAQALMSRYAIDAAVLAVGASGGSGVLDRRVHIDSPYASTKVQLLAAVGAANRVRVIWLGDAGMAAVVGFPLEIDLVEMLYTSLLVQATRAMADAGRGSPGDRSRSFRRAFLLAYAQRVGERLVRASAGEAADAAARAAGSEMVLASRSQEVDDEFDRLFPRTRKMRSTRVDARGWHAGRDAADRATIARGRLGPGGAPE